MGRPADGQVVKLQRLVLHGGADDQVFTLDLHPRLTVITGAGRLEREGLINEVLGSLGSSRPGVHLELVDAAQRSLAVFRPAGGRHRVVDVDRGVDVTAEFERDGTIDLLAGTGIAREHLRRSSCLTGADLRTQANRSRNLARLAAADQGALWDAASALREVQAELAGLGAEGAVGPLDAELVALIETRHGEVQEKLQRLEDVRSSTFVIAGALCLFAVMSVVLGYGLLAGPLLLGAAVSAGVSLVRMLQLRHARQAETQALEAVGMTSYLAFQLQRVDGLVSSQEHRRHLVALSEIHREAVACWRAVAGDVEVGWAWDHRHHIRAAGAGPRPDPQGSAGAASILASRLADLAGTNLPPLVLDEPFGEADEAELRELISVVLAHSAHRQLLLLTGDPRLAEWAGLEQMAGTVLHLRLDAAAVVTP